MVATAIATDRHRAQVLELDDVQLTELAKAGNEDAIRAIIKRHNQRLFRVARSIVRNDTEAEDVVQAGYVRAFTNLASFRGEAQLTTWLTRIVLNEALGRVRSRRVTTGIEEIDVENNRPGGQIVMFPSVLSVLDPETETSRAEVRILLERTIDKLPATFRAVFILRDVEGMSIEETADTLSIKPETVKTRLHRARKLMRIEVEKHLSGTFAGLFPFDGARCTGMADRVILRLRELADE
ncbi:MAG TPA: RNA polymerase sigma factor [Devosiaceae bacterium]